MTSVLVLAGSLLAVAPARADDADCTACCRAGGLPACPSALAFVGEGTTSTARDGRWETRGAWILACDGSARPDPEAVHYGKAEPRFGDVVFPFDPLSVSCIRQACARPAGACVGTPDERGISQVVGCDDGLPLDARALRRPPAPRSGGARLVVVVDGHPVVAERAEGGSAAARPVATTAAATASRPAPVAPQAAPIPAPTPAPPVAQAPAEASPWGPVSPSAAAPFQLELPAEPADPCAPPADAMRAEARKRVDLGDDRRMAKDRVGAAREYRAALTMDTCNGYAWLGVGEAAQALDRPDLAIRALRVATRLLPRHHGALVLLAKAYEGFGQRPSAAEAYRKALELSPGLPDAVEGYARTR